MKKICISFLAIAIIVLSAVAVGTEVQPKKEYLRIHIRADSNEEAAQAVKYLVKDAVVEYLTPVLSECHTKAAAESRIKANLKGIEAVSDKVLAANDKEYKSNAKLNNEKFPTRTYGDLTLESGYYDALVIELGSGKGDNWWCVVYPPLCFTGSGCGYVYKSKILEIIDDFKRKN